MCSNCALDTWKVTVTENVTVSSLQERFTAKICETKLKTASLIESSIFFNAEMFFESEIYIF